jgi:RNA polymerase sigma factor (sigma-70 family)
MRYPTTRSTLLDRLTARDESAWEEFFAAYRPIIRDVGAFKGLDETECDDLVQEVMLRFYRRIGDGFAYDASIARFRTYFNRIVKGCVYDCLRRRRGAESPPVQEGSEVSPPDEILDMLLLEKWRNFIRQKALEELQNTMAVKTFQIFEQSTGGRPTAEIAALFDVTPAYVNLIKKRGRDKLARIIRKFDALDGGSGSDE